MSQNQSGGSGESSWLFRSMAIGWAIVVAVLLINIVSSPAEIGSPATESEAVVRANERVLEMVKWTISTILLVGGGLIGLNWYQNEKRVEGEFRRQTERMSRFENRIVQQNATTTESIKFLTSRIAETEKSLFRLRFTLEQTTLSFYGYGKDKSWGEAVLDALEENPSYPGFVIDLVENFQIFLSTQDASSSFTHFLARDYLEPIAVHMDAANKHDLAKELREIHTQMNEAAHSQS